MKHRLRAQYARNRAPAKMLGMTPGCHSILDSKTEATPPGAVYLDDIVVRRMSRARLYLAIEREYESVAVNFVHACFTPPASLPNSRTRHLRISAMQEQPGIDALGERGRSL